MRISKFGIHPTAQGGATVYDWPPDLPVVSFDGATFQGPAVIHRVDFFQTVHAASYQAVRAVLPSDHIQPVRWVDGRAVIFIGGGRYGDATLRDGHGGVLTEPPYGEVIVGAMVTLGPAARALPIVGRLLRAFVLHLPVTTAEAAEVGRVFYGDPKFVADMDFVEAPTRRSVTLAEGGREILTLVVHPSGPVMTVRNPTTFRVL